MKSANLNRIYRVLLLVVVLLAVGVSGAQAQPVSAAQGRAAVHAYLARDNRKGLNSSYEVRHCGRFVPNVLTCAVVEYGSEVEGFAGDVTHRLNAKLEGRWVVVRSSLFAGVYRWAA